ncbi:MAG: hypothetical protein IJ306_09420 [Oscillospiraceae bacterium]|nr:hypothetical protein [Oscillospiraceae bacterium]
MEKRKKRLGDRYDGYRVRSLSPMTYITPFIMKTRNDASNLFAGSVELGRIENYIKKKRREDGLSGFGFLHVILAAYVRLISQKPAMNRFIAGQRIYQHGEDISVCMMVKKSMELNAQESAIKVVFNPGDTADDIYRKMDEAVEIARRSGDSNLFDKVAKAINYMPALILRAFVSVISFLDYFGIMPKIIHKASPFHCSMFITNLGSLGIPPIYHHLYNFGTCPVFLAFGAKRTALEVQKDGSVEKHKYVDFTVVSDERITDGHYYANAFKQLDWILRHPDSLDNRPEQIVEDVD